MADHTINVNLVDGIPVVKDENGSDSTTGHFFQTFLWQTTLEGLSVNFTDGEPFWLQDLTAATASSGQLTIGPVTVVNPFEYTYPYGVTVTSKGQTYSRDPKVIIDGNMKYLAVTFASVLVASALIVGVGIFRRALATKS